MFFIEDFVTGKTGKFIEEYGALKKPGQDMSPDLAVVQALTDCQ